MQECFVFQIFARIDIVCFRRLNLFKAWELILSSVLVYIPALLPVRELKRVGHQLKSIRYLLDMGSRDLYSCRARVSAEKADRKLPPNRLSYFSVPSSSPSGVSWLGTEWRETLKIKPWRFGQSLYRLSSLRTLLEMVETGNGTVTPVVSNLRIDPALVDGYLPFAHFFPSFFIRMLYLLHSLVKYIYMPIYPRVLVYQET